jgi:hypothetical protein
MRWTGLAFILVIGVSFNQACADDQYRFKQNGFSIQISVVRGDLANYEPDRVLVLASHREGITFGAQFEFHGEISGAWATDLDGNGRPEAVVWIRTMGSGSYGDLKFVDIGPVGIALRDLPPLSEQQQRSYSGHDQFGVGSNYLLRSFPVYHDGDPNCCPTGGQAEITYRYDGERLTAMGVTEG